MNDLETRLNRATQELRADVARIHPPPFEPRSRVAPMLVAAVLAIAIGLFAVFALLADDDQAIGVVTGTGEVDELREADITNPEDNASPEALEETAASLEAEATATEIPTPVPTPGRDALEEAFAFESSAVEQEQILGPISAMASGETATPVDGVGAWNSDESLMLLYRRTDEGSRHVVLDAATGDDVAVLDINPPDIEQVYWSPGEPSILYYVDAGTPNLMAYDVAADTTTIEHTFDGCDEITSGRAPVVPSMLGDFSFVCITGNDSDEIVVLRVESDREVKRRPALTGNVPQPSLSGDYFVVENDDGTASVLDENLDATGTVLGLGSNDFAFVFLPEVRDAVVAALYNGPAIGTLVLLPLDGSDPQVIIGPDAGDEYPPGGTRLSAGALDFEVAVAIAGPASPESALAGHVLVVDFNAASGGTEIIDLGLHGSTGTFDYWSTPFVAKSNRHVMVSSDNGGDAVNTTVLRIDE